MQEDNNSSTMHFTIPRQIEERLEKQVEEKGLTKSEIVRRGTIRELSVLENNNEYLIRAGKSHPTEKTSDQEESGFWKRAEEFDPFKL